MTTETMRALRAKARELGCLVDYTYTRETLTHSLMVDAPKGCRFYASDCHFLGGGDWYGTQADGREVIAAVLADLADGLRPCAELDCETCAEEAVNRG